MSTLSNNSAVARCGSGRWNGWLTLSARNCSGSTDILSVGTAGVSSAESLPKAFSPAACGTPDKMSGGLPARCLCYNRRVIFGKGKGKSNAPPTARTVRAIQPEHSFSFQRLPASANFRWRGLTARSYRFARRILHPRFAPHRSRSRSDQAVRDLVHRGGGGWDQ